MTTMNCKGCGEDKPTAEMFVRGGKPIRTCKACKTEQMKGGSNKKAVAVKAKDAKPAAISAPAPGPVLEIQQGHGLKAWIDEPYIMLEQADGEGKTDALCLSRSEFRQLIDKFGSWSAC